MAHSRRKFAPGLRFNLKLLAPLAGQLVILGAAIIFADGPVGFDPTSAFKSVKSGVERTLLNLQRFPRYLLQTLGDRPTMERFQRQGFQNQKV